MIQYTVHWQGSCGDTSSRAREIVLKVRTLGMFAFYGHSGWIPGPPPRKGGELIQLLVIQPRSVVSNDQLAAMVSSTTAQENLANRLHLAASGARAYLRQITGDFDPIRSLGHGYAWRSEVMVDSDLARFTQCYNEGTPEAFDRAVQIYQGEFLAGEDVECLQPLRVRLSCMYVDMLERLATDAFAGGRFGVALQRGLLLAQVDRSHEGASRLVMRCFSALERRASIVTEYNSLKSFLQTHLGVEPSAETRQLYYSLLK